MTDAGSPTTGVVTFLFTDIEGSTRLELALGTARYATVRERHRELLRAAFAANGGTEQSTQGDSFFVLFESARSAIHAAIEGQRALAREPWPDGIEVLVRMGMHAGEAMVTVGDVVGYDVNRAARIAAVANGGQIVISDTVRALAGAGSDGAFELRDLGEHRLKDLLAPERLAQVVAVDLQSEFPPLHSIDARPNNLPTQLTSFVGRHDELEEALGLLRGSRLLTLTGPGGIGKTRLSLQIAAAAADDFPDGVWFVPLEPVRERELVAPTIARTIGVTDKANRPVVDGIAEALGEGRVLFVLDNFEQVIDAAPVLPEMLAPLAGPADPRLQPDRPARLRRAGVRRPWAADATRPVAAARAGAAEPAHRPAHGVGGDARGFRIRPAVRGPCPRGATRIRAHGCKRAGNRQDHRAAPRDAAGHRARRRTGQAPVARTDRRPARGPPRAAHRRARGTCRSASRRCAGAIAWSYDLLEPGTRRLLNRLAVFVGGCDLDLADRVCGPASEVGIDVLDGVATLVDQSLLRVEEGADEQRYVMFDAIREYAAEMLTASGECDDIEERRSRAYLDLAEEAAPQLAGADQRRWLDRLEREHDNLRATLMWAANRPDPELAVRVAFALWRFWQQRGYLNEARVRLDDLRGRGWDLSPVLQARLAEARGGVAYWQADQATAEACYQEALELWREIGDRREIANALYNRAYADAAWIMSGQAGARCLGGADDARGGARRSTATSETRPARATSSGRSAASISSPTRWPRPRRPTARPWRSTGPGSNRTMEAWSLHMLALALVSQKRADEAKAAAREALTLLQGGRRRRRDHARPRRPVGGRDLRRRPASARAGCGARRAISRRSPARTSHRSTRPASDRSGYPTARQVLPPDDLERYAAEGAAMSLDEAVAYAFETFQAPAEPEPTGLP